MLALVDGLQKEGPSRETARRLAKVGKGKAAKGRPKNYVFRYQPREKTFNLSLQFTKSQVPRDEVVRALQSIIEELMREDG